MLLLIQKKRVYLFILSNCLTWSESWRLQRHSQECWHWGGNTVWIWHPHCDVQSGEEGEAMLLKALAVVYLFIKRIKFGLNCYPRPINLFSVRSQHEIINNINLHISYSNKWEKCGVGQRYLPVPCAFMWVQCNAVHSAHCTLLPELCTSVRKCCPKWNAWHFSLSQSDRLIFDCDSLPVFIYASAVCCFFSSHC